jgi:hypothetical protein
MFHLFFLSAGVYGFYTAYPDFFAKNLTGNQLYVTVFCSFLLLIILICLSILQENYELYKHHIRVKRLFVPVPQDHFYRFSEERLVLSKKYNSLLKASHLIITLAFLYICLIRFFYN